jgi:hypothetical protein
VCSCPSGQTKCAGDCVDTQTGIANCGTCGNVCGGGNECNTAVCNQGTCGTTPAPGAPCNGGLGTCNTTGRCVATACAGKDAPNPCFPNSAPACGTSGTGRTCHCGTDIHGNVACYDVTFCNNPNPEIEGACTSNADCEARSGQAGSVCFSAENCCGSAPGVPATGCALPCPLPAA